MKVARIEVNGAALQLPAGTVVAVSLTADSLENVAINSSYTNEFDVPLSRANRRILGNVQAQDAQGLEYAPPSVNLFSPIGGVLVSGGLLLINRVTNNTAICAVIEGATNIFTALGDSTLQMLGIGQLGTMVERTAANIVANLDNDYTSGYSYATFDYGDAPVDEYQVTRMWPATFIHKIIERIFEYSGYTLDTSVGLPTDAFFRKCALAYAGDRYNKDSYFIADMSTPSVPISANYESLSNVPIIPNAGLGDFGFTVIDSRRAMGMSAIGTVVIIPDPALGGSYDFDVRIFNVTQSITYASYSSGLVTATPDPFNYDLAIFTGLFENYADGDLIQFQMRVTVGDIALSTFLWRNDDGRDYDTFGNLGYYYSFYAYPTALDPTAANRILDTLCLMPDMKCTDFLKQVLNMFLSRISVDTIEGTARILRFKDYSQDTANGQDWSNKVDTIAETEQDFSYGEWAQRNTFSYSNDSDITEGYGSGFFDIANGLLDPDPAEIVALDFSASNYNDFGKLVVPILAGSPLELAEELAPRICYLDVVATSTIIIVEGVSGTGTNDYNQSFFDLLAWQQFTGASIATDNGLLGSYWQEAIQALSSMQKVTAHLRLTAKDFEELDFFTPKYVYFSDGLTTFAGWYFLQLVDEYKGNGRAKVELINLNING